MIIHSNFQDFLGNFRLSRISRNFKTFLRISRFSSLLGISTIFQEFAGFPGICRWMEASNEFRTFRSRALSDPCSSTAWGRTRSSP